MKLRATLVAEYEYEVTPEQLRNDYRCLVDELPLACIRRLDSQNFLENLEMFIESPSKLTVNIQQLPEEKDLCP